MILLGFIFWDRVKGLGLENCLGNDVWIPESPDRFAVRRGDNDRSGSDGSEWRRACLAGMLIPGLVCVWGGGGVWEIPDGAKKG